MSERDFNMVSPAVWGSERFAALPTAAKLSFMYLLTSPHQNSAGGYRLPAAYAAADMGCSPAEFAEALKAIRDAGMAVYDDTTKEVYVTGWFKHCPPTNQKHAKGTMKIISRISSDVVREANGQTQGALIDGQRRNLTKLLIAHRATLTDALALATSPLDSSPLSSAISEATSLLEALDGSYSFHTAVPTVEGMIDD